MKNKTYSDAAVGKMLRGKRKLPKRPKAWAMKTHPVSKKDKKDVIDVRPKKPGKTSIDVQRQQRRKKKVEAMTNTGSLGSS